MLMCMMGKSSCVNTLCFLCNFLEQLRHHAIKIQLIKFFSEKYAAAVNKM